ncbi:MAG: RidA family protein [Bacilli bacterium]
MNVERRELESPSLNKPLGVFCQAVEVVGAKKLVFVSGLTSRAPDASIVGVGDIKLQTETVVKNLNHVLSEAGGTIDDIVKVTVYIRDMEMFKEIHEVRNRYFKPPYPASTMVEVSRLVDEDLLIEIEAIAVIG